MEATALIAGLIGALLTAGLGYWVRTALARKAQREAEQRLAYVHFVRVSELIAVDIIVGSIIQVFIDPKAIASLGSSDGKYDPSHKISVLIVESLQKLLPEKLKETPGVPTIPRLLRALVDSIKESQLNPEQLSKLPKDTVLAYSFFLNYLAQLRQVLSLWADFFEHDDRSWLTPENVHDHWLAINRFFGHARILRTAFIKYGAVSSREASELLKQQVDKYNEAFVAKWKHKPKIQAALQATDKAVADAAA